MSFWRGAATVWFLAGETLVELARLPLRRPLAFAGFAVVILAAMGWLDRPLALWSHGIPVERRWFFAMINEVGRSGWMFALAAAVLALALLARRRDWMIRAGFVIGGVALGGLVINVVKVVIARARPRLLIADGTHGFHWLTIDSNWNSFPSGHSQAIAGFGAALACIWPRFAPLFLGLAVLPAAARMVMANHFLADVMAGYAAGVAVTFALARAMAARGLGPIAVSRP